MNNKNAIKRGVSLYSFQEEYFLRKMTLEDCIATAARLGGKGIEVISEQIMPGFPNFSDAFYDQWHQWMEKYGTTPIAHDMFLDIQRFKGRQMTEEEMIESVIRDLKHAHKLGCTVVRFIVNTPAEIMEKSVPYAEQYGVKIGLEIHSPFNFDHEWIERHMEVVQRVNSPYLGVVPDMGIFEKRFPRVRSERAIRDGGHEAIIHYICDVYDRHEGTEHLEEDVAKMGGNEIDLAMADWVAHHQVFTNPRRLLDYMSYIIHIHGKFYEMLDNGTEYSIPYEDVIPVLIEGGYDGYIASEYEGNRHIQDAYEVDSVEQVRRQQEMFKHLLGESM